MKALGISIALVVGALLVVSADASILTSDTFSYPDGNLVPNGGWANHSGSGSFIQVATGEAVLVHGAGSREDANKAFTPTAGTLYYGIDFSVDDLGTPYVAGPFNDFEYFAHFRTGFNFSARLDIVPAGALGDYSVGISSDQSTADVVWPTDLTYATTYRAIVSYNQVTNQAQLWIDAALPTDPSILGFDQPDPGDSVDSFALRQSNSDADETVRVDNLIVSTTFGEAVPEPATIGLLLLGGLLLRRRH